MSLSQAKQALKRRGPRMACKYRILSAVQRLLPALHEEPLAGKLWIVDETTIRIRG
jgi:hypothetical protein